MGFISEVLCIDDDQDDLLFMSEAIAGHSPPYKMVGVSDGQQALDYLENAKKTGQFPCLIIMDINMPKMDGKKTIPHLKSDPLLSSIPLVVFTTSSNLADKSFFEKYKVTYITKPSQYQPFIKKIKEMLSELPGI
jgi:CheY-like chemotaxis protein